GLSLGIRPGPGVLVEHADPCVVARVQHHTVMDQIAARLTGPQRSSIRWLRAPVLVELDGVMLHDDSRQRSDRLDAPLLGTLGAPIPRDALIGVQTPRAS